MKVHCKFLGARALKDGTKTGMLVFPENTDRHALVDLEGDAILTKETNTPAKDLLLSDIRDKLDRLIDYIEQQERQDEVHMEEKENEGHPLT